MKRAILGDFGSCGRAALTAAGLIGLMACSGPADEPAQAAVAASAWVTTPMIQAAERTPQGLTLRGLAAPSGRVVVRAGGGVAYATGADDQGRFALGIAVPAVDTLFVLETQNGQDASPAPYRLLVTRDPAGPVALLTPGAPTQRLDRAGPLDVIDSDGRAELVSGRATPGARIPLTLGSGAPLEVVTGVNGRWVEPIGSGTASIAVGERAYARPALSGSAAGPVSVTPQGAGRVVSWTTPGGSTQQSWFPDAG